MGRCLNAVLAERATWAMKTFWWMAWKNLRPTLWNRLVIKWNAIAIDECNESADTIHWIDCDGIRWLRIWAAFNVPFTWNQIAYRWSHCDINDHSTLPFHTTLYQAAVHRAGRDQFWTKSFGVILVARNISMEVNNFKSFEFDTASARHPNGFGRL